MRPSLNVNSNLSAQLGCSVLACVSSLLHEECLWEYRAPRPKPRPGPPAWFLKMTLVSAMNVLPVGPGVSCLQNHLSFQAEPPRPVPESAPPSSSSASAAESHTLKRRRRRRSAHVPSQSSASPLISRVDGESHVEEKLYSLNPIINSIYIHPN